MLSITIDERVYPILCGFCRDPIGRKLEDGVETGEVGCATCDSWAHSEDASKIAIDSIVGRQKAKLNEFSANLFAKNLPSFTVRPVRMGAGVDWYRFTTAPVKI